jgi:integrase
LDRFLDWKRQRVEQGELTERSWGDYQRQCQAILAVLGKTRAVSSLISSDFDRLRVSFKGAPKTVEGLVTRSKVAFKWIEKTYDLRFNFSNLVRPSAKKIRQHRNEQGVKLFTPAELKLLIEGASPKLKAMILLGINCGLGNEDCATLKIESIVDGWHNHPRPKTGVLRRAPLWPETLSALAAVVGDRKTGVVFQTRCGNTWSSDTPSSAISSEFRKLAIKVGVKRTFYDLRRTFQTVGDDSLDPVAVKAIMGHVGTSMSDVYRQLVPDDRLQRVSEVVRNWFKGV